MGWWKSANTACKSGRLVMPAGSNKLRQQRGLLCLLHRMRSHWGKLHQLDWSERCLLAQALVLLPLSAMALQCLGFRRLYPTPPALWTQFRVSCSAPEAALRRAYKIARMVRIAAGNSPAHSSCLERSLTLWWLLRRQGITSEVCLGVRKVAGQFEAHAWVAYAGRVLNDRDDVHRRFASLPIGKATGISKVKSP